MPNLNFSGRIKQLTNYIEEQESRDDIYQGSVIKYSFDYQGEIAALKAGGMSVVDIIDYVAAENPVLWAQYWLRNPTNPAKPLELFSHQKDILNCSNKYKLTRCGRQVGKTLCMAIDMLFTAMNNNYLRLLYVAPYLSQVKVLFEKTLMPLLLDVPEIANAIAKKPSHPYFQAIFKNHAEISAMTAGTRSGQKGAGIRGTSADRLYLDEMDFMGSDAIGAIMAVMFARPDSKVWVSSTPIGKREEFYKWATDNKSPFRCKECIDAGRMGSPFHLTSHVSPLFSDEADAFYKRTYPLDQYGHEVLAEWGEESMGIFRHTDLDHCLALGRSDVVVDESTGISKQVSYTYDGLVRSGKNLYILGVDWNKESTGVQLCVVEFNPNAEPIGGLPPFMYRVFRTDIINAKEFTQGGSVTRIMELDRELNLSFIYADEGYGTIQIEAIKKIAMDNNRVALAKKVIPINMASTQEIYDPITKQKIKKPMKAFMVDNAARVVESRRLVLPDLEDERVGLVGQMREYVIIRKSASGHPVYSMNNEDMLTAFMLAVLGFAREYSELINVDSINTIGYTTTYGMAGRAAAQIEARWAEPSTTSLEDWGVARREPILDLVAANLGLPYEYTTDSRPQELRPVLPTVAPYERSMRGARTGRASGYSRPLRRTF